MDRILIVYKTDVWHSYKSREIIGLCTDKDKVLKVIIERAKKEGHTLTSENLYDLSNINQTQSYSGEGEFHFEEMEVNVLL